MRPFFFPITITIAMAAALPAQAVPSREVQAEPILTAWKTMGGHMRLVRCLAFAPDGTLASGGKDRLIKLWDRNGKPVRTIDLRPGGG